jgi:hypothetical protein
LNNQFVLDYTGKFTLSTNGSTGGNISFYNGQNAANSVAQIDTTTQGFTFSVNGANIVTLSNTSTTLSGNVFIPGTIEQTTGNSYLMGINLADNGNLGYDSTLYYDHANEALRVGNLSFSDTPAATGVSISSAEAGANGTIFFNVSAGQVLSLTGDRRVKWGLLDAPNVPNPAFGSIIYKNYAGANGFYLCDDPTVSATWDKIISAKGNVVTLPGATSAPTAVAGGIYYDSTSQQFYMCRTVGTGWQQVTLV